MPDKTDDVKDNAFWHDHGPETWQAVRELIRARKRTEPVVPVAPENKIDDAR